MAVVRSVARWGSLLAMIVGAAASVGLAALIQACGGKAETDEGQSPDGGAQDAKAETSDAASDGDSSITPVDAFTADQGFGDIAPADDVSLDVLPAE